MKTKGLVSMSQELIQQKIYFLRGEKVMFDKDLAVLYGVETRELNQAVKRNIKRFPVDFMFQLSKKEMETWKSYFLISQTVTSNVRSQITTARWGGTRKLPYAFTEQGVAMLSSVLKSERAIQVNVQIIRTFTQMRRMLITYKDLKEKLEAMEKQYNKNFRAVFETLQFLIKEEEKPKKPIGFRNK